MHKQRCHSGLQSYFNCAFVALKAKTQGKYVSQARRVARNLQWGGCLGGLGAEPPAAGGQWGSGGKAPSAGGWGFGGKAPSRRRHGGLGAETPALENFAFFCKNNFILGLF